jgi:type VI secretion system secreted protein VgrG
LYVANGVAAQAQADSTAAFIQGQLLIPTTNYGALSELSGLTLTPGVYNFDSAVGLTDTLTLSGAGTYVFQIGSSLTTGSNSVVALTNGASACDVYWIVSSAATIGTNSDFAGNILAGTQITLNTGASVAGGLYAGSQVTLDDNEVSACGGATSPTSSSTTDASATSTTSAASDTTTATDITITVSAPETTTIPPLPTTVPTTSRSLTTTSPATTGPVTTTKVRVKLESTQVSVSRHANILPEDHDHNREMDHIHQKGHHYHEETHHYDQESDLHDQEGVHHEEDQHHEQEDYR